MRGMGQKRGTAAVGAFYGGPGSRQIGKGQGVRGSAPRRGENREERGGPRRGGGQLGRPASAPGRRAWAAPLPRDRGGRRGGSDAGASG
jgi:hypothetical protein